MAPAFFLAAGGLDIPCRLLLRAPNLPLQLTMGCGVHLLVQNRRRYMHTHSWAEIGGVQLSLAAGVHIVSALCIASPVSAPLAPTAQTIASMARTGGA